MKRIRYTVMQEVNQGTVDEPEIVKYPYEVTLGPMSDAAFESNLAIAKAEAYNGEVTVEDMGEPLTPAEQRETAYNTAKIIPWEDSTITVTEAAQKWQYYAAEGNPKAEQLQALIAAAKAEIRAQFPDE